MTITDYRNFDVLIARAGEGYRSFVVDAPAGEGSVLFDLPLAADEGGGVVGVVGVVGRVGLVGLVGLGGLMRGVGRGVRP